jgi:hypothetical protein
MSSPENIAMPAAKKYRQRRTNPSNIFLKRLFILSHTWRAAFLPPSKQYLANRANFRWTIVMAYEKNTLNRFPTLCCWWYSTSCFRIFMA